MTRFSFFLPEYPPDPPLLKLPELLKLGEPPPKPPELGDPYDDDGAGAGKRKKMNKSLKIFGVLIIFFPKFFTLFFFFFFGIVIYQRIRRIHRHRRHHQSYHLLNLVFHSSLMEEDNFRVVLKKKLNFFSVSK